MRLRGAVVWLSVGASLGAAVVAACVFCGCASPCWTAARAKTAAGPVQKRAREDEEPGWRRIDADSDDFYDLRDGGALAAEATSSDDDDSGAGAACRPEAVAPAETITESPAPSRRTSRRLSRRLSSMSALLSESMYAVAASFRSKPQFRPDWSPPDVNGDVDAEPEAPSAAVPRPDVRGPVAIILHATMRHLLPTSAAQRHATRPLAGRSFSSLYAASPAAAADAASATGHQEIEEVRLEGGDGNDDDVEQPSPALGRYDRLQIRTVYTNAAL